MPTYALENVLLPDGWRRNVLLSVDARGDITAIGEESEATPDDAVRGYVVPGMINLHSHAHQRAMVGLAERAGPTDDSFWTWREVMYHYVGRLAPEHLEAIAAQLYVEMLTAGYTSVAEFQYLHHGIDGTPYDNIAEMSLRTANAARETGIGMTNLPVLYGFGGFGSQPSPPSQSRFVNKADAFLEIVERLREAGSADPNVLTGIAPHSPRAIDKALLISVLAADSTAAAYPIHMHVAEQNKEVDDCLTWCGRRPVEWVLDEFDVDERWCLIHATHMQSFEVERLADSGAVAGLCPTTEANLGDGLFELVPFLAHGGRFGIGSDSHISVSPVEELRWLEYGQRLKTQSRNVLSGGPGRHTGRTLYDAALAGGAQACGRKVGKLEVGCRADWVVLDNQSELLHGREDDTLVDTWLFAGNKNLVTDVYVAGRHVVRDGHHIDADAVASRFKRAMDELAA